MNAELQNPSDDERKLVLILERERLENARDEKSIDLRYSGDVEVLLRGARQPRVKLLASRYAERVREKVHRRLQRRGELAKSHKLLADCPSQESFRRDVEILL